MNKGATTGLSGTANMEEEIRTFLLEAAEIGLSGRELTYDDSLISSGLIDSLAVLDIIAFLEARFDVQFEPADLTGENFDRISSMAKLVRARLNEAT